MRREIRKQLSANDIGLTGGHQAGILVPRKTEILSFFPTLDARTKNPRMTLVMREAGSGSRWEFNFIYYNNRFFGGTRNEYRLTCMTQYLRSVNAKVGDDVVITVDSDRSYFIELEQADKGTKQTGAGNMLVLAGGWKIINLKH